MIKTVIFTIVFLIFAGCAAKSGKTVDIKHFGDDTLAAIKKGKNTLGCEDARFMADLFAEDNYTVISFTVRLAMDFITNKNISKEDQKKMDEYAAVIETLNKKLEAKYKNDPKTLDSMIKSIFNTDINRIVEAAISAYLGFATKKNYEEFIESTYCGAKTSPGYRSPEGVSKEKLRKALLDKFGGNSGGASKTK